MKSNITTAKIGIKKKKTPVSRDFLCSPLTGTLPYNAGGMSVIPGQEAKITDAQSQKTKT